MTFQSKLLSGLNMELHSQMDRLLEGIQIIDPNWKYLYINDILSHQINIPKQDLLGKTMMEMFPGIEQTQMFSYLQRCMDTGEQQRFENLFTFPDATSKWFEIVAERVPGGMCVLTLDVSPYKEALESNNRIKNLYSFLRQINQSIVHIRSEKKLLHKACEIAVAHGKFDLAWMGLTNDKTQFKIIGPIGEAQLKIPKQLRSIHQEVQQMVLKSGNAFTVDATNRKLHPETDQLLEKIGMNSLISLPVRKNGHIYCTFNLYSTIADFIGTEEADLLLEVSGDLSFALDNFERIKKHKSTEKLVLENEKKFRSLIEKSSDMKTMADVSGRFIYGSPSITKVLGYVADDLGDLSIFDIIHADDLPEFIQNRNELLHKPGSFFNFKMRVRHKNGGYIWTEGTITNLLHEPGVNAVVSNFRDVTDKNNAQEQLEFDRRNLQALINNTNDLEWSVDKHGKLIIANRCFDEYLEKVYGRTVQPGEPILHQELSTGNVRVYENFYRRALKGEAFSETILSSIPGRYSEISFYPIRHGDEVVGTACNARDITAQLALQKKLEDNIEQLLQANAELDRFVYSISHDLRSPLTSIRGLLSIIEEETLEPETSAHIQLINGRIDRLDMFIKNVLNYSRVNRAQVQAQVIDPHLITSEIVESLSGIKTVTGIDFKIDFVSKAVFCTDRQAFSTIMENLISNAIKFQDPDRPDKFIKISGISSPKKLTLTIEDNGVGIAKEHHRDVFKMFYRLPGTTEGSGIGLYLVYQAVEKLNGFIELESAENVGTKFKIQLKNLCDGKG